VNPNTEFKLLMSHVTQTLSVAK